MGAEIRNGHVESFSDPMAYKWAEKYSDKIENIWFRIPEIFRTALAAVAIFLLGVSVNGEWLNVVIHLSKQLGYFQSARELFANYPFYWLGSVTVSFSMYITTGCFLHWYFYIRQRDIPEKWKCQPKKFLPPELERHEIIVGTLVLFFNCTASSALACYIANGGWSMVYYKIDEYPYWWLLLQIPIIFIYQDYGTYLLHRLYHRPFLYKHFHKIHHKYKQPTAWSVTAIHPVESLHLMLNYAVPLFVMPCHWGTYYSVALYVYFHGILNHSGVDIKAQWWQPWQPDTMFHDNHHQYFHVNYGFNLSIWDKVHGTYRQKDKIYTEDDFSGGKLLLEASEEELKNEMEERLSENPSAYRDESFLLTKDDLQKVKKIR